jgi:hypothetical protein
VLVGIEKPKFFTWNFEKIAILEGNISYVHPYHEIENLPNGLYFWKSMDEGLSEKRKFKGIGFLYGRYETFEDTAVKHRPDSEKCLFYSGEEVGQLIFKDSKGNVCTFDEPDYPSPFVKDLLKANVNEILKVKEVIDKTIPNKIDITEEEQLESTPFEELMDDYFKKKLPYVVIQSISVAPYYHYYDGKGGTEYFKQKQEDPVTGKKAAKLTYYITFSPDEPFTKLADFFVWNRNDQLSQFKQYFLTQIFKEEELDLKNLNTEYEKLTGAWQSDIDEILKRYFAAHKEFAETIKKENLRSLKKLIKIEIKIPKKIEMVVDAEVDQQVPDKININKIPYGANNRLYNLILQNWNFKIPYIILRTASEYRYYYYDGQWGTEYFKEYNINPEDGLPIKEVPVYYIAFQPTGYFIKLVDFGVWDRRTPIDFFIKYFLNLTREGGVNFDAFNQRCSYFLNDYRNRKATDEEKNLVEMLVKGYFEAHSDILDDIKKNEARFKDLIDLIESRVQKPIEQEKIEEPKVEPKPEIQPVEPKPEIQPVEPEKKEPKEPVVVKSEEIFNLVDNFLESAKKAAYMSESIQFYHRSLQLLKQLGQQGYEKVLDVYINAINNYRTTELKIVGEFGANKALKLADEMKENLRSSGDANLVFGFNKKYKELQGLIEIISSQEKQEEKAKEIIPLEKDLRSVYQSLSALTKELRMLEGQIRRVVR